MKKIIFILLFGIISIHTCVAQTFAEWFEQKKTQIKYLGLQIAALEVYMKDAEQGYKIVSSGLNTIGEIKNGEFNLHSLFFSSLKTVNPKIRGLAEITEIVALQVSIVELFQKRISVYKAAGNMTSDDLVYIGQVYSTITDACSKDIDDLTSVITDYILEVSDDGRIKRIDQLHKSMQDKYAFTKSFTGATDLLSIERSKSDAQINSLQSLYGLKY